jgi:phosphatidylglycerophosphate synthase
MTSESRRRTAIRWGALAIGVVLFFGTLYYVNFRLAIGTIQQLGVALPLAIFFSGLWHLARTWAWSWCFPQPRKITFARLARVRLSAEAFSYLTLRGIAGEPLKVVLLADSVDSREATAAVALERLAYLIGTTIIVGAGSLAAIVILPLTGGWFRVFRAFAIGAGVIAALATMVVMGRGTYLQSLLRRIDGAAGTTLSQGPVARFVTAVERQMLELVRSNPKRLVVLMLATVASYICMSLEAWVILRASGAPITWTGALAVETFSRVASFASAFIPANLGALEASSLAAAAAVGAVSGGAALALARRLRGLFWAGLGLAIYPRDRRPASVQTQEPSRLEHPGGRPTLFYFPRDPAVPVGPCARLAGLPIVERVLRSALRAGYTRIIVWAPDMRECSSRRERRLKKLARAIGGNITVAVTEHEWQAAIAPLNDSDPVTAIGAGTVVSPALLSAARAVNPAPGQICDVAAGSDWRESGVLRLTTANAVDRTRVLTELHRRRSEQADLPSGDDVSHGRAKLALRIVTPDDLEAAEQTIRRSSYKDTDAKVARFNRRISLPISIALIRTPLTANQMSVAIVALGFYSGWLFSLGHYWTGVLGGFLSLAASVLDGCDGEIARLKYQESALGCWIETFGDYSYYIAIFVGLSVGAVRQTGWEGFYWVGAIALAGTILSFALLIFLRSRITGGRPERLHTIAKARFKDSSTWSRIIWRISFVATRAAMPYGIMAFSLVYALPGIVILAAVGANVYWINLTLRLRDLMGGREEQTAAA